MTTAPIYYIDLTDIDPEAELNNGFVFDLYQDNIEFYNKKMLKILRKKNINLNRGDFVRITEGTYRNDGLFIFDGTNLLDLESDIDEYGSVPEQFKSLKEFPLGYHHGSTGITHNSIIWLCYPEILDECIENVRYDHLPKIMGEEQKYVFTTFDYEENTYTIIWDYPDYAHGEAEDILINQFKEYLDKETYLELYPRECGTIDDPPKNILFMTAYDYDKSNIMNNPGRHMIRRD